MKKIYRSLAIVLAAIMLLLSLSGCAKLSYIANGTMSAIGRVNDGSWKEENQQTVEKTEENKVVIDTFKEGTYGGKEFKTQDDAVNYYTECYNNTKAKTAVYTDKDGNSFTYYDCLSEEKLTVDEILVDGSRNEMLNNTVPNIVKGAFPKGIYGLPPSNNRDPLLDNTNMNAENPGDYDFRTSHFKPEYCLACNVADNQDGTITMTIQPKDGSMSARGADSQGSFFEVLKNLGETVAGLFNDYDALSWASGTTEENCTVAYQGGTGKVTIDTKTNLIVSADYEMKVFVEVNHANISVIKDKSGALYITHYIHYPASADYLMESKGLTKK